jgi:hypothetical protein
METNTSTDSKIINIDDNSCLDDNLESENIKIFLENHESQLNDNQDKNETHNDEEVVLLDTDNTIHIDLEIKTDSTNEIKIDKNHNLGESDLVWHSSDFDVKISNPESPSSNHTKKSRLQRKDCTLNQDYQEEDLKEKDVIEIKNIDDDQDFMSIYLDNHYPINLDDNSIDDINVDDINIDDMTESKEVPFETSFICDSDPELLESDDEMDFDPISNSMINFDDNLEMEIDNDCGMFSVFVKQQMDMRCLMLKKNLKTYINPYRNTTSLRLKTVIIKGIKRMGYILSLQYHIGAMIADILFTDAIIEDSQIQKYAKIINPFVGNELSQDNFMNQMLVFFDKYQNLIEPDIVNDIFESLLKYEIINAFALFNWYNDLNNDKIAKELNITQCTIDAVHNFLDDIINSIQS